MTRNTKGLLAGGFFLAALGIGAWSLGGFTKAVGSDMHADVTCPDCKNQWQVSMAEVFSKGQQDPQLGWHVHCPKCTKWSPIRPKNNPTAVSAGK